LNENENNYGDYDMKVLLGKRRNWLALFVFIVLLIILIYRIGFHRPVPGFNEEALINFLQ